VNLTLCHTIEEVLRELGAIISDKGIDLYGLRVERSGPALEWKLKEWAGQEQPQKLVAPVICGKTKLIVLFAGPISAEFQNEVEEAARIAAQSIEVIERRLWSDQDTGRNRSSVEFEGMIGQSAAMQALKTSIIEASESISTILITGESGTGKELAARAIHRLGARPKAPFISVNCGAFTESLLESELFGYVKGAFTGAAANHKGLFEAASGGAIFLDEIGEMPLAMQVKLLRVLQEHKIRPLGANTETSIDVRVVAATNRDLLSEVQAGRFREDLYYRLAVLTIVLPPLRERHGDIPHLVSRFLGTAQKRLNRAQSFAVEQRAMEALCNHSWPGNVRELENTIERLIPKASHTGIITFDQVEQALPKTHLLINGQAIQYQGVLQPDETLDEHLDRQRIELYKIVMEQLNGNHTLAARRLGVDRSSLYHRLKRARARIAGRDH
jgi:transcriptional regulator with PAS, ATPase and Fis domain